VMLNLIIAGEGDLKTLALEARGRLRSKHGALREALTGRVREHHRLLLKTHLTLIDNLDAAIGSLTAEIERYMSPFADIRDRLDAVTGIDPDVATVFISEMGTDLSPWPTYRRAASCAGLRPGQHESAGKRKSGRTRYGNRWIKQAFVQAAWSTQRAHGTYMQAHFRRARARRGPKKAAVAVANSLFVRCYVLLEKDGDYRDLGTSYYEERSRDKVAQKLVRKLERLGYKVSVSAPAA